MQDPGTYRGQKNLTGLRHGEGKYVYSNAFFTYEGQWENNLKHGHGKLLMWDESWYEGSFLNGEIAGEGKRIWNACIPYKGDFEQGDEYVGQFLAGHKHGRGKLIEVSGVTYDGEWQQNKRHGRGLLTTTDGAVYDGEFRDHAQTGQGTLRRTNGAVFEGQWLRGERHGEGQMQWPSGTVYRGGWQQNSFHGQGQLQAKSGSEPQVRAYTGVWAEGRPTAQAVALTFSKKLTGDGDSSADEGEVEEARATPQPPAEPKPAAAKARPGKASPTPPEPGNDSKLVLVVGEQAPPFSIRCKDAQGAVATFESGRLIAVELRRLAPKEVPDPKKKGGKKSPEPEEPPGPPEILSRTTLGEAASEAGVALFDQGLVVPEDITATTYEGEYVLAFCDVTAPDHPLLNFTAISAEASAEVSVKVEVRPPEG